MREPQSRQFSCAQYIPLSYTINRCFISGVIEKVPGVLF